MKSPLGALSPGRAVGLVSLFAVGLVASRFAFAVETARALLTFFTSGGSSVLLIASLAVAYLLRMLYLNREQSPPPSPRSKSSSGSSSAAPLHATLASLGFGTKQVAADAANYGTLFNDQSGSGDVKARQDNYMTLVNSYYNLVTDFYEWGWGKSFHFGRRYRGEDLAASLARHEHYLALQGQFGTGMRVLDIGCGVGGPMRAIARFSGCDVIGINNNAYQISRGIKHNAEAKLSDQCSFRQCDFMKLSSVVGEGSMDGAYAIEATCHAPDKAACFAQVFKALKPGGVFVGYEWTMTDNYDPTDPLHRKIKKGVEEGDGLPDLYMSRDVPVALKQAGFDVVECRDLAVPDGPNCVTWYHDLKSHGWKNFKLSPTGVNITKLMVRILEATRLAPRGTVATHNVLDTARIALVKGGELGVFTPMLFFKAVKPLTPTSSSSITA